MKIYFDHLGQNVAAELYYNSEEIEECVLVTFENGFNNDVLFSRIYGAWTSTSDLQSRYPQTYKNLQAAIVKHVI